MSSLPSAGSIFADKLRIYAVLGRGSMGIVYGATDLILGRCVALKVIAPEVLDGHQRLRFEREARAVAALRSEHAVRIYEATSTPMPYLVMEYPRARTSSTTSRSTDVPAELIAILERCLARRPDDRFASGVELAASLANAAGPRTTPSHVILVTRPEPPPRRPFAAAAARWCSSLERAPRSPSASPVPPSSLAIQGRRPSPRSHRFRPRAPRHPRRGPPASPRPSRLPPPVFTSIRPAERIHHVHVEPGPGFEDREKFAA